MFLSECVPSECLCGFHCYRFVVFGVELIMRGFHGCCLWALGLLLWWVSEGALDMLAFVCECWFMIWLLLRVLSFKMIITEDDSEEVLFSLFVRIPFRVRFLSVWWMCCLLMDFIGFMCSMNAVWVHDAGFLGLFIMNVMWQSFCDCCEQSVESCVFSWDCKMERCAKLNNMLCEKERFDGKWPDWQVPSCSLFQWFPSCRRGMSSWMHEMTPCSGHTCMYGMMRIAMISCQASPVRRNLVVDAKC